MMSMVIPQCYTAHMCKEGNERRRNIPMWRHDVGVWRLYCNWVLYRRFFCGSL